jgi:hypothetical protein
LTIGGVLYQNVELLNNMRLTPQERKFLTEEWLNLEKEYNPFQTIVWWTTKFDEILEKREENDQHEQDKFLDGFGHQKNCAFCKLDNKK